MPTFDEFNFRISITSDELYQALQELAWDTLLYRSLFVPLAGAAAYAAIELEEAWVFLHDIWLYGLFW